MPEETQTVIADEPGKLLASRRPFAALRSFFSTRWRGEADLARVFWRDMIVVGSMINGVMTLAAVALLGAKTSTALAVLAFLAPVPLNVFLFVAVWRSAERNGGAGAVAAKLAAALWLAAASLL